MSALLCSALHPNLDAVAREMSRYHKNLYNDSEAGATKIGIAWWEKSFACYVSVYYLSLPQVGTSTIATVFLIVNAALGAGLLNFPKAFDQAGGVLVAVLVQASLIVFVLIALYVLATTSDIKQSTTLQEVKKNI